MVGRRQDKQPRVFRHAKHVSTHGRIHTPLDKSATAATASNGAAATPSPADVDARPNLPRLYFTGKFYCDPSTTNNWVNHYDVAKFRPSYQQQVDELNFNGSWYPDGTATFALVDCTVTGSYSPAKALSDDDGSDNGSGSEADALVDESIMYNSRSVYGKISDLDPQMQTVSALYGVRVNIGAPDASDRFSSLLMPTSFRDLWGCMYNPAQNDPLGAYIQGAGSVYQGLLRLEQFAHADSTFLAECAPYVAQSAAVTDPATGEKLYPEGALSIRFRVDYYCNDPKQPDFCYGNVTGYITPWLPNYPRNFDAGRRLYTTVDAKGTSDADGSQVSLTNTAYAAVETRSDGSKSLFVDLVNSLYRLKPTGTLAEDTDGREKKPAWTSPYQDQGDLDIGYFENAYDPNATRNHHVRFVKLADIPYQTQEFDAASCVLDIPLSSEHAEEIKTKQLCVRSSNLFNTQYRLSEAEDGFFARADNFVFHLQGARDISTAEAQTAKIYVTKFGELQKKQVVSVGFDSSGMQNDGQSGVGPKVGVPVSALAVNGVTPTDPDPKNFVTQVVTGADGYASLTLAGGDCGRPRGYIEGQLYGLRYAAGDHLPSIDPLAPNNEKVNVLLFDVFDGPKNGTPSWIVDILPIFKLYANLYPAMDRIVRLDDYGSVVMRSKPLKRVFTTDENNPAYMPTTRDLSVAKRNMIVQWLEDENLPFMNRAKEDVFEALQTIIELEHATMPPYLTALFSIKPGFNQYIAHTLREVAEQEMLHMALACNILTAIGGAPVINKIGFVPKYPGSLPSGLRSGLIVRLRKCSKEQLKDFMAIEAPEEQYLVEDGESTPNNPLQKNQYTIGWLYDEVEAALEELNPDVIKFPDDIPNISDDDPRLKHQVTKPFGTKLFQIRNLADAKRAIEDIKSEGEGSPGDNDPTEGFEDDDGDGVNDNIDPATGLPALSHYFRFAEIVKGRRLIVDKENKSYAFNGPRIDLNMDGVYNMQDDPKIENQPPGSLQRERMESFALKYQGLLNGLHIAFTEDPDHMRQCFGLMFQLTIAAQPLMEMPALDENGDEMADGTTCGVSFQVPITETGP